MKHLTLRNNGHDEWIPIGDGYGQGLCPEELALVFPEIDWTDDDDVDLAISHRRDTGFRTIHLEQHPDFLSASKAFYKGEPYYISIRVTRWLRSNGFNHGDTLYIKATVVQGVLT